MTPHRRATRGDSRESARHGCRLETPARAAVVCATLALLWVVVVDPVAAARVDVYTRTGCTHCAAAKAFLADLARDDPHLEIVEHDVQRDPRARERLAAAAARAGQTHLGVPTFVVGDVFIVGFDSAEATGVRLRAALAAPAAEEPMLPWIGRLDPARVGLPAFSVGFGLLDGFNPCAMWVLVFLLSLLVNLHDRRRMLAVAGTFVLASGVAYFAFLAAWLNAFLLIGAAAWVQRGLGVLAIGAGLVHAKDAVLPGRGPSLAIPERAKPGLYARARRVLYAESLAGALAAAVTLAFAVNTVELLCSAGLPALFTRVLTLESLPTWQYYGYVLLYVLAYLLDDAIVVAVAVVTLSRRKLGSRGARMLQAVSGAALTALGVWLVARPP